MEKFCRPTNIDVLVSAEDSHSQPLPEGIPTFNEWWASLSEGQQKAFRQDKWSLADISFQAGISIGQASKDSK